MLNKEIIDLLNQQVNKELFSAYFYLDMSNYYLSQNLNGFANWFKIQAQEEKEHAFLFMAYLQNNDAEVILEAISKPDGNFSNFEEPLAATLSHEQYVTQMINKIYEVASREQDFRTMQFLGWFISEQGEEEKNASELLNRYKLFSTDSKSLYLLDKELDARIYTPTTFTI